MVPKNTKTKKTKKNKKSNTGTTSLTFVFAKASICLLIQWKRGSTTLIPTEITSSYKNMKILRRRVVDSSAMNVA